MIVKTGANYQAEGGYIEASREGDKVTIATDSAPVVVPDINGVVIDSLEKAQVSKDPSFSGSISCVGLRKFNKIYCCTGYPVVTSETEIGLLYEIGTTITIQGHDPELKEGSKNCVIKHDNSTGFNLLYATGPNPVAILGVVE